MKQIVILVVVILALVGAAAVYLTNKELGVDGENIQVDASISLTTQVNDNVIVIVHNSGDTLNLSDLEIRGDVENTALGTGQLKAGENIVVSVEGLDFGDNVQVVYTPTEQVLAEIQACEPTEFTLIDTENNIFKLSDFRGKVVILDFMKTMCLPCQAQITHLKEVKQHFGDNVIIISIGIFGDTNQELETFKENRELTWRFAADADYSLTTRYNIEGAPYLMIIDVNGNIRFAHLDLIPSATLIQKVDEIM